ncbi:hypothetical protein [Hymenobacter arizonensis]|uniref:hypothetical protein n=1 Tax=Hymenobacter arizonensis TaxID=1227077 RepID=UPI001160421D|nr:hypothetical protein [Hymenobacter arizonensis]
MGQVSEQTVGRQGGHVVVEYAAGPHRLGDLQTMLGHAKQLLARRGWHKVFGDQRLFPAFTPEQSEWLTQYWLQMAQQRSRRLYGAVLVSPEVFAQLPPEQTQQEGQEAAMTYRFFDDPAAAESWLAELP